MVTEFRGADVFVVCSVCGATYSDVLSACPQCKEKVVEEEGSSGFRFLCIQDKPCPVGGADGFGWASCDRLHECKRARPTARSYGDSQPVGDDVLCEFMVVKKVGGKNES